MRSLNRIPWLMPLLAAGAMLFALAPLPAAAHGGHDHGAASAPQAGGGGAAHSGSIGAAPVHGWSQSCPAAPGSPCCCGGLTVCHGSAKIGVVNSGGWAVLIPPPARGLAQALPGNEPLSLLPQSLVLPRAPPFFS